MLGKLTFPFENGPFSREIHQSSREYIIFLSISQPTKGGPKTCPCHVLGINACLPPDVASVMVSIGQREVRHIKSC